MAREFDIPSVLKSYRWLGHCNAWTEVNAFHPLYRPGRENHEHNRRHGCFPVVRYVQDEKALLNLVRRLHGTHMVCYGINPRPGVKTYRTGHPRAHRDHEVEVVKNFYIDFDMREGSDQEDRARVELLLEEITGWLEDMGFARPVKAFTGNGFHLLFAVPDIRVADCPDIKERFTAFRDSLLTGFKKKLSALEVRVDSTADLKRMAKVYGTAKPGKRAVSTFYGDGQRIEDLNLRDHLLGLDIDEHGSASGLGLDGLHELPPRFAKLLDQDGRIRDLWLGVGKKSGDLSRSGYDYSLLRECLARGITDVRDLAAILALRPDGSVRAGRKGEQYIRATISRAIRDLRWLGPKTMKQDDKKAYP